jgi:hypothetical protein
MPAASAHPLTSQTIHTEAQLRALIGEPAELTCAKISDRLNPMRACSSSARPSFVWPPAMPKAIAI